MEERKAEEKEEEKEEKEEENYNAGIAIKKTSKRGIAKFFSQTFRRSATPHSSITKQASEHRPDFSITKQASEHRPHSSITKQATDNTQQQQLWIRKEPDADGYFLLQLVAKDEYKYMYNDMFLTSDDATSLTIARKLC